MTRKVVLFFPKLEEHKPWHWFPQSLLSLAAPLVAGGYEVVIVDERITPDYSEKLLKELSDAVCLGISSVTGFQLYGGVVAAKRIRQEFPDLKIAWGGPHVTNLPEESLRSPLVDFVVIGHGEESFSHLVDALDQRQAIVKIPGIGYRSDEGQVVICPADPVSADALRSRLPYELLDIPRYVNPDTQATIYISSYGCPALCTFCSTRYTRRWMPLPFSRIEEDLGRLMACYPFKMMIMYDATIFVKEERARQICQLMAHYGLSWICDGRATELSHVKDSTWAMLAKSGLIGITMGLESGSPRILKIMKKGGYHLEKIRTVIRKCHAYGIPVTSGVVFGAPSETAEDLQLTFDVIEELRRIHPGFGISTTFFSPLPGTDLYEHLREALGFPFPDSLRSWAD